MANDPLPTYSVVPDESILRLHFHIIFSLHESPIFLNQPRGSKLHSRVVRPLHLKQPMKKANITVIFCTFVKLMEPLILIKPLSLLLKWCFYSRAGPAIIEPLLHFSHRKTHVTSQPEIHMWQSNVAIISGFTRVCDGLIGEGSERRCSMTG